jgi:hypothetical protein
MFCSYAGHPLLEAAMDNRINELRRKIRALRVSMLEAETIMREQINRDEDCSFVAGEILKMRVVMSVFARERHVLGDNEPILVNSFCIPRRPQAARLVSHPAKRRLVPRDEACH